jgi:hypothetical protein
MNDLVKYAVYARSISMEAAENDPEWLLILRGKLKNGMQKHYDDFISK